MLMTHLADKHLSANGIIVFNGSRETLLGGSKKALPMHQVAKGTVMQMGLNLSVYRLREDIVYENSYITMFACDTLL